MDRRQLFWPRPGKFGEFYGKCRHPEARWGGSGKAGEFARGFRGVFCAEFAGRYVIGSRQGSPGELAARRGDFPACESPRIHFPRSYMASPAECFSPDGRSEMHFAENIPAWKFSGTPTPSPSGVSADESLFRQYTNDGRPFRVTRFPPQRQGGVISRIAIWRGAPRSLCMSLRRTAGHGPDVPRRGWL